MNESMQVAAGRPWVVHRTEVPIDQAQGVGSIETRPFDGHTALRSAVPAPVNMSWKSLQQGQTIGGCRNREPSLLIVLHGTARLTGSEGKMIEQGDVVTLPGGCEYGFTDVGATGLRTIQVQFRGEPRKADQVTTLEQLLARNEVYVKKALASPYFQLLRGGALASPERRARLRDGIRVFSDAFQSVLFVRQALCEDEQYARVFHEHLREELGHNELLTVPEIRLASTDPVIRATATWFCHQMMTLDNTGKAALVHLVLETVGYHFHTLAAPLLSSDVSAEYFDVHAEADEEHKDLARHFLENQHPETYARLCRVIETGWETFDAMMRRVVQLVELE